MFAQRREMWVAVFQKGQPQPEQEFVLHSTDHFECEQWLKLTTASLFGSGGLCNALFSWCASRTV